MITRRRVEIQLTPWELVQLLIKAGVAEDGYAPSVAVVETTTVNKGRTVVISWALNEQDTENA